MSEKTNKSEQNRLSLVLLRAWLEYCKEFLQHKMIVKKNMRKIKGVLLSSGDILEVNSPI